MARTVASSFNPAYRGHKVRSSRFSRKLGITKNDNFFKFFNFHQNNSIELFLCEAKFSIKRHFLEKSTVPGDKVEKFEPGPLYIFLLSNRLENKKIRQKLKNLSKMKIC